MASIKTAYAASAAVTISLASLASDTNLLAGQESNAIDNTSNLYLDYLLSGLITTGTTPTDARQISVYVAGIYNDTPLWPDVFDGTDSNETVTSSGVRDAALKLATVIFTNNTSNRGYYFGPISVASLFGGTLPPKFVVFVVHNTGVNLNATAGNHIISVIGQYETVA